MKKCHENSGGYACGYCDVILCVVAYFLSVNLLHVYVPCLCSLCVVPTFSFEGIKNFLT